MWINWTWECPDSLFPQQSFLLPEGRAKAWSTPRSWVQPVDTSPLYSTCVFLCMRVSVSTTYLSVLEVLLSSQGGSHPSTKLRFREWPALTRTGESWHVLLNHYSRKVKWSQMRLFYFSHLPQPVCPSENRLIKPLETSDALWRL